MMKEVNLLSDEDLGQVMGGCKKSDGYEKNGHLYYKVVAGDCLSVIAQVFHTTVKQIQDWNSDLITNVDYIQVDWELRVG